MELQVPYRIMVAGYGRIQARVVKVSDVAIYCELFLGLGLRALAKAKTRASPIRWQAELGTTLHQVPRKDKMELNVCGEKKNCAASFVQR